MSFIPVEKMKKLREACKNGDEKAKKILSMQLGGKEDFSPLLDEYFKPVPHAQEVQQQPKTGLESFLEFNNITKDSPDYKSYVNDYYKENPNENRPVQEEPVNLQEEKGLTDDLLQGITGLITTCDQTILAVANNEELNDATLKGALSTLQEIKQSSLDNMDKLRRLKSSFEKKEQENVVEY